MARIEGLMVEIAEVFGTETSMISTVYFAKKNSYLFGGAVGALAGLLFHNFVLFLIVGGLVSVFVHCYADSYLVKIDHVFFTSPGRSRREIFDRYYAVEIGRRLSLRMTEPTELLRRKSYSTDQNRLQFQRQLSVELEREFKRSDWRFFVAECLYYQK